MCYRDKGKIVDFFSRNYDDVLSFVVAAINKDLFSLRDASCTEYLMVISYDYDFFFIIPSVSNVTA